MRKKFNFGDRGVWHKSESEDMKAKDLTCRILEDNNGVLYIFTDKPILKGAKNLTWRTATIFSDDFTPNKK